jgi:hypothetical protein
MNNNGDNNNGNNNVFIYDIDFIELLNALDDQIVEVDDKRSLIEAIKNQLIAKLAELMDHPIDDLNRERYARNFDEQTHRLTDDQIMAINELLHHLERVKEEDGELNDDAGQEYQRMINKWFEEQMGPIEPVANAAVANNGPFEPISGGRRRRRSIRRKSRHRSTRRRRSIRRRNTRRRANNRRK